MRGETPISVDLVISTDDASSRKTGDDVLASQFE